MRRPGWMNVWRRDERGGGRRQGWLSRQLNLPAPARWRNLLRGCRERQYGRRQVCEGPVGGVLKAP